MESRDLLLLERAFHEAETASWLYTAPNPRVGALALKDGHVIGRGCHQRLGGAHAEEAALADAGAWDAKHRRPIPGRVDEMAVSLEPCSSHGSGKRRQPCTEHLIEAGVRRLVVGALDPNPEHAGAGLERLRAKGIEVHLAGEGFQTRFEQSNAQFLRHLRFPRRPWVLLKWAASLDGKTATDQGVSQWISGPDSRAEVHELRGLSDAILAGKNTLLQDDPQLTSRPGGQPLRHQPLRVLVDPEGETPSEARVFQEPGPRLWLLAEGVEPAGALARRLQCDGDRMLMLPRDEEGKLDLKVALSSLRQEFGVRRLLVEGGAGLHGWLLDAGFIDAVVLYEAPILLGGRHGAVMGGGFASPQRALNLGHEDRRELGPDLRRAFQVLTA
ncbi:MAG: bifunctional diaminohydroxyphosphoribosylaminopyrimidine deaminase/5-amino-6-(5-phosphoribosylamino)uracil reductase RibD [Planctomycetota bacterium]|nr:MAG: bifunctional diaminohydroxyphosphoribosylaminopyrimidine deaminase/5-amino-6-(5-phosphoribosylamino)uracil reductase RibD [Planctomycetota bacterium]